MQTKTDWQYHIEEQKRSGLNKAQYCRKNGLSKFSFYEKSRKLNSPGKLVELPFLTTFSEQIRIPAFEFHFQIPFSFRFRLNLSFGKHR